MATEMATPALQARDLEVPQCRRTVLAGAAALVRADVGVREPKHWQTRSICVNDSAFHDALQGGVDPRKAQNIVKWTTRFATFMCVIIVFLKVGVFLYSGAAIVRTSALDSIGDLVANIITLVTSQKMRAIDIETYPVGQGKMEPIGVIVFSTLMASAMQELITDKEKSREEAVNGFMDALFAEYYESDKEENTHVFQNPEQGFAAFLHMGNHKVTEATRLQQSPAIQKMLMSKTLDEAKTALEKEVHWAAEVEDFATKKSTTYKTAGFLSCCIVYKFCLWLYCIFYAIPNTGSTILMALANDKRNDFVATTFAVICMFASLLLEPALGDDTTDMIDPAASLLYSSFIIYTWCVMVLDAARTLSQRTVPDVLHALQQEVPGMVKGSRCKVESIACYTSSSQHIVEIDLAVADPECTTFAAVATTVKAVKEEVANMEDIERVIVTTS